MDFNADIILKFRDICQPFLVWCLCCEFSVKDVFRNKLRIIRPSGTAAVRIFNRGFDAFFSSDPQYPFVIYFDIVIPVQIITYSPVSLIRTLPMDFFYLLGNLFVFFLISWNTPMQPFIVCSPAHLSQPAKGNDRISVLFMFFFDRLIDLLMPDQTQPRLLSISSSFFKKDASISARSFSALRIRFSARSFSSSDISSSGFERPRLSFSASTPPVSYLTV